VKIREKRQNEEKTGQMFMCFLPVGAESLPQKTYFLDKHPIGFAGQHYNHGGNLAEI